MASREELAERLAPDPARADAVRRLLEGSRAPADLERYGELVKIEGPSADLKVDRANVAEALGSLLDSYAVADVSVQDPPLEQTIARVFEEARADHDAA